MPGLMEGFLCKWAMKKPHKTLNTWSQYGQGESFWVAYWLFFSVIFVSPCGCDVTTGCHRIRGNWHSVVCLHVHNTEKWRCMLWSYKHLLCITTLHYYKLFYVICKNCTNFSIQLHLEENGELNVRYEIFQVFRLELIGVTAWYL